LERHKYDFTDRIVSTSQLGWYERHIDTNLETGFLSGSSHLDFIRFDLSPVHPYDRWSPGERKPIIGKIALAKKITGMIVQKTLNMEL